MITLQAVWQDTEIAIADLEDIENLEIGIQDILDQIIGTIYESVIEEIIINVNT